MRNPLLVVLLFAPLFLLSQKTKKPALKFDAVEIIREDIPYDSKDLFVFSFKNNGKTPIRIESVQTSCGCTTAEKPSDAIGKKGSGQISVSYDTKRVGEFVKSITVTPNLGDPVVLTIRGNVLPEKQ
jgi:hypothetical protein